MKKLLCLAAVAALALSCTKENVAPENGDCILRTYTATFDDANSAVSGNGVNTATDCSTTKTAIGDGGVVTWVKGDTVRYYTSKGTLSEAVVPNDGHNAELAMEVPEGAKYLIALYGVAGITGSYSNTYCYLSSGIPSTQSGKFGQNHISFAKCTSPATETHLSFQNLTSCIKFTLKRSDVAKVVFASNDATQLWGDRINLSFPSDSASASFSSYSAGGSSIALENLGAGTFYITTLPCSLSKGFTVMCYDAEGSFLGTAASSKQLELKRNTVVNLGALDERISMSYDDLSAAESANCYVVSRTGAYKIRTVKGNSAESVGACASADVLWETYGTGVAPEKGSLVNNVKYEDGYLSFITTGNAGSALVGVKDGNGTVLWTWHIWCTPDDLDASTLKLRNNAGVMMDRNLGALTSERSIQQCFSLLYRYGSRHPFIGGYVKSVYNYTQTIEQAAITGDYGYGYGWSDINENPKGWSTEKNINDPCPPGYRVPDKYVYAATYEYLSGENSYWDVSNRGVSIPTDSGYGWIPYAQALTSPTSLSYNDIYGANNTPAGAAWTCSGAYYFLMSDGYMNTVCSTSLIKEDNANPVRCVTEASPVVVMTDSVTVSKDTVTIDPKGSFDLSVSVAPKNCNVSSYYFNDSNHFTRTANADGSWHYEDKYGTIGRYQVGAYSPFAYYGSNDDWKIRWTGTLADKCVVNVCPAEPGGCYGGWYLNAKAGSKISFTLIVGGSDPGDNHWNIRKGDTVLDYGYTYNGTSVDFSYTFAEAFKGWFTIDVGWGLDVDDIDTDATVYGRGNYYGDDLDQRMTDSWKTAPSYKFRYDNHKLTMY